MKILILLSLMTLFCVPLFAGNTSTPLNETSQSTVPSEEAKPQPLVPLTPPPPPPTPAEQPIKNTEPTQAKESIFQIGGSIYLALENWSRVGEPEDSKMGFGFGGDFGVGIKIDDMRVLFGPHIGLNRWSADYSKKSQSVTDSVYVEMSDAGLILMTTFDEFYLNLGFGDSTISSGMIVQGKDIKYNYDGEKYTYTSVNIGMNLNHWLLGISTVNYSGYAKYCDRIEFNLGYGF